MKLIQKESLFPDITVGMRFHGPLEEVVGPFSMSLPMSLCELG